MCDEITNQKPKTNATQALVMHATASIARMLAPNNMLSDLG